MKSKLILNLLFIFIFSFSFAQKEALKTITENDLKAHLEFIASDYMQGRDFGTEIPGLDITADYIRAQCQKMGLMSGANDYFQKVELVSVMPDMENTYISLTDRNNIQTYKDSNIFSFGSQSKSDTLSGEVVFAGYGWHNKETGYNDLKDLDLKDKIVVIMTRNPETVLGTPEKEVETNVEMAKMQMIFKQKPKALIVVADPLREDKTWFEMVKSYALRGGLSLKGEKARSYFPGNLLFATEPLADAILKETGKTLLELQKEINNSKSPKSFTCENCRAKIVLSGIVGSEVGHNVIGIVEGSDPVLKNECIVFTAHYDHVGMAPGGKINNGADDNGTGTVALIEIAEAFMSLKKKPKRSLVFAWVTAEEKGLLGSKYYSQNPVIPLEKTLVNINLDMVGRSAEKEPEKGVSTDKSLAGPNGIYIVSGEQSSELIKISNAICEDLDLVPSGSLTKAFLTRSDYFHFYKNGIPILGLSTGLHEDYHTPGDVLEKIDYNKMKRVSQYCFLVAHKVANKSTRIKVDNPVSKQQ